MTSINETAQTAAATEVSDAAVTPAATETTATPAVDPNAPVVGTAYPFHITRIIKGKDGAPFLVKGDLFGNYRGTVHVSELLGKTRELRDQRIRDLQSNPIPLYVEVLELGADIRLSEKLAAQRLEVERLMNDKTKVSAVVLEDAKEDSESVYLLFGDGHRARLHARGLKDSTREARDARVKTLKKDTVLDVTVTGFRRHPNPQFARLQIDVQEVGREEKKPQADRFSAPARRSGPKGPSPLGNKTGDRAKAEAKRAERRQRDQAARNGMKGSGGGKK